MVGGIGEFPGIEVFEMELLEVVASRAKSLCGDGMGICCALEAIRLESSFVPRWWVSLPLLRFS